MIDSFRIGGYRAYKNTQTFEFSKPSRDKLGLNLLVGQNNSGKSTPLSTIREMFHQSPDFVADMQSRHEDVALDVSLRLCFDGDEELYCLQKDKAFYIKTIRGLEEQQAENRRNQLRRKIKFVPSRRAWSDRFGRGARQSQTQLQENLFNVQRNQEAPLGTILADIIRSGRKDEFDTYLRGVLPEVVDWSIDSYMEQDFIVYINASGRSHALGLLGDGFSSIFRLAHILFASSPGEVVLLDEPELSLHPEAQKSLYSLIANLSRDRQVIIATHSPYMVNWTELAHGARLFRLALDESGYTNVNVLSDAAVAAVMPVVEDDLRNRKNFDVLAKEVFFRDRVLFCEGQEDVHYIDNYLISTRGASLPMFGYGSGGASLIEKWILLAVDLGMKAAALFDRNEIDEAERLRGLYGGNERVKIWSLPADDIRDKPDKGIDGIFYSDGSIKTAHKADFDALMIDVADWLNK